MTDTTIKDISVELVTLPAQPAFRWRSGLPGAEPEGLGGVLTITTADGCVGRAYTSRGVIVADLVQRRLSGELMGQDAFAREWLWHRLWELDRIEEFPIYALGLVDVALWDLAGRSLGVPVAQLLGTFRDSIPAYASTVTYDSEAEFLDVIDQCLERGFRAVKLHAWGDVRRDSALIGAVREHVGPEIDLMYDGSAGFDLADAVRVGDVLAANEYRWFEEPMREFNIGAHRALAERVRVPLLVGETSDGAHMNTADFIAAGCAGYVRTSALFKAGITGAMRIAHLADAHLLRAEVHGMGAISRALCMAIPNTSYYEALVWGNPIRTDPVVDPDGTVRASLAPGLDWEAPGPQW